MSGVNGQQVVGIAAVVFALCGFGWFMITYRRERRSLWLGVSFLAALLGALMLVLVVMVRFSDNGWIRIALLGGGLAAFLGLLLFPVAVIISLLTSGTRLIRREGFSVSNALSLSLGLAYIAYLVVWPLLKDEIRYVFFDFLYTFLSFVFVLTAAVFFVYTLTNLLNLIPDRRKRYQHIIVLGCGLSAGRRVTPLLAARVDKGIEAFRQNEGSVLIMSGGQGADELVAEGEAMRQYALEQGLPPDSIWVEDQSTTTAENLQFSTSLMDRQSQGRGNVLVVTTSYHVLRALLLAKRQGLACEGRGAKTRLYFSINAFVREWVAYLVMYKASYLLMLGAGFMAIVASYLLDRIVW